MVSFLAARSGRLGLASPSATASAALAKSTVAHSAHRDGPGEQAGSLTARPVVSEPTHTTKMTGECHVAWVELANAWGTTSSRRVR